ncbi:MAG: ABC transporter substrate-binding protein [Chloroflexi bacterium]|nr:ABC transporter substrate-binding protein [Chloroflexota bacterium]
MKKIGESQQVSRRHFLRMMGLGATLVAGSGILAACQAAATPTSAPAAAATQAPAAAATKAPAAPAAPVATQAPAAAQRGGTLVFGYPQITSYDHFCAVGTSAGGSDVYSRRFVFSKLVTSDVDFKNWVPDLAEKYAFTGNTCTFNLRKTVKWHDGQPFTSKDVIFSIQAEGVVKTNFGSQLKRLIVGMADYADGKATSISGVKAPDDYTIVVEMTKPYRETFLAAIDQTVMVPSHILGTLANQTQLKDMCKTPFALETPIGTGPFKVTKYVPDQYVEYEPYADYHFGKPLLDKLIYRSFADAQSLAAALEKGEVHVGTIPPTEYKRFQTMQHIDILLRPGLATTMAVINTRRPALKDKRVRQALLYAIDRKTWASQVQAGTVEAFDTPFYYEKYGISPTVKKYAYDPEKAKQLLKDAGWDSNTPLKWYIGGPLAPATEAALNPINDNFKAVGIKTEYDLRPRTTSYWEEPLDWDVVYSALAFGTVPFAMANHFRSDSTSSSNGLKVAALDPLFDTCEISENQEEIKQAVWKIQDILSDECPIMQLTRSPGVWVINKKVQGGLRPVYALWTANFWGMHKVWVTG